MRKDSRDWSLYNRQLVDRGRVIDVYLSKPLLKSIDELTQINADKVGRPYRYGNCLIMGIYGLKCVLRFAYRQIEGFARDIAAFLKSAVPNFRTIWWRINCLKRADIGLDIRTMPSEDKLVVSIDSTGIKSINDGEYRSYMYDKRKDWLKFHIVVDSLGRIRNARITKSKIGDSKMFVPLLRPLKNRVSLVRGDGAYDTNRIFKFCRDNGMPPNIPVRITSAKNLQHKERRDEVVRQLGMECKRGSRDDLHRYNEDHRRRCQKEWKEQTGYGKRWIVESTFAAFKQVYGESVFSKRRRMVEKEIAVKVSIFNSMR